MKKGVRFLSLFLVFSIIVTLFSAVSVSSAESGTVYYLSASGSDDNDGLSADTPFATMKKAMAAAGSNDATIKIIGTYTMDGSDCTNHTGHLTIEGVDSSAVLASAASAGVRTGGPVTLQNITYTRGTNAYIVTAGQDITFGEDFSTTASSDWFVFGGTYGATSVNDINVTVNSGNFTGKFNVGAVMPSSSGFTVNNDANININGGSVQNILLGSTSWGSCGATTFAKNVVIQNNGGTISKISAIASGNGSPAAITGALIVINNNGVSAPTYDTTLDSISIGSKYYINSGSGGYVTPVTDDSGNAVEGKFNIIIEDEGSSAVITNGDTTTTLTKSGEITLNSGTTTVTYSQSDTDTDSPANPGTTIPMSWKQMDKGYITLCFDDNNTELGDFYDIITGEYNMPFCAAVPSYTLPQNLALLHEIENHGGEILSHTQNHLVIKPFETTWDEVEAEFSGSYDDLTAEGFNINGIILAGGTGQISESDTEYRSLIELVTNKYYKYSDKYGISTQYWKPRNWFSGRTADDIKSIIDTNIENKTWEIIYAHRFSECSEETLREVLDYLVSNEAAGLVEVVTYKYMYENFGDWESEVNFGDTKYTVEFYGTDKTTYLGKSVAVKGGSAIAPENIEITDGYTLAGWSASLDNVTDNYSVYAICKDSDGNIVSSDTETPVNIAKTYYLDSENGLDTNSGTSADSPMQTVNAIVSAVGKNDFSVVVMGTYTLTEDIAAHDGTMTVYGYDDTAVFATGDSSGFYLGGNIIIKDIILKNGQYSYIAANGKKFVLGNGITTQGTHQIVSGKYYTSAEGSDITVNSGTYNKLVMGSMAAGSATTFIKDVKAVISGGKVNNLILGNDGWSTSSQKGSVYDRNIAIQINGGTVSNITALSGYPSTYNGAIEIIFNNGTTATLNSLISEAEVTEGKYFVYSEAGGSVDFAYDSERQSVTGKFVITIPEGMYAEITNGKEVINVFKSGDTVELKPGTSNIVYKSLSDYYEIITVTDGENEYQYYSTDEVEITHGGTVIFPEYMERSGMLFGGWYSDKEYTSPVLNGETVSACTLYARWIPVNENDLILTDIKVRTVHSLGLRFISSISNETIETLISLNDANSVLDFSDDNFNRTDGIGYGTVVFPADLLESEALAKDLIVGEYCAETVPAQNTFSRESDYNLFTAVIVKIPESSFTRYYSACPYITYTDASGCIHTVYGNTESASLYETAEKLYENGSSEADYIYENILTKADGSANPLANTYRALNSDKKLTIGYLGGSITNGSSAVKLVNSDGTVSSTGGDIANSYVNRTTAWFKESYPEAEIEFVNAGISDTATNFANYRLNKHLMNENGHDMPDLVFVEFTSNDWIYDDCITQSSDDIKRQIESLVLNIYTANPYADIVFLFSARSENSASRLAYIEIAEYYGIPYIDMGIPMQSLMTARGASNESSGTYYYTVDNLHPSAEGYGVYFGKIKTALGEYLSDTVYYSGKTDKTAKLPEAISRSLWTESSFVAASGFTVSGSVTATGALKSSMYGTSAVTASSVEVTPDSVTVTGEDANISFTFTGTAFALIFGMNSDGFNIDYTINGRDKKNITIDEDLLSGQKYSHTQLFVLEQELAYDTYTVNMTFNATSGGNVNVKIGGAATFGVDNGLDKLVALTFDDGPNVNSTGKILDVLEKYGAHGTFFAVGCMVNTNTAGLLNRIVEADCEIGNHGYNYSYMNELTAEDVLENYNNTQQKIYDAAGVYPKVFRAPGLLVSDTMYETIPLPFINGYSSCSDWNEEILLEPRIENILENVADGRVVLLHDVALNAEALEATLPQLIEEGYTFVTVSELYKLRGYNPPSYAKTAYTEFNK